MQVDQELLNTLKVALETLDNEYPESVQDDYPAIAMLKNQIARVESALIDWDKLKPGSAFITNFDSKGTIGFFIANHLTRKNLVYMTADPYNTSGLGSVYTTDKDNCTRSPEDDFKGRINRNGNDSH